MAHECACARRVIKLRQAQRNAALDLEKGLSVLVPDGGGGVGWWGGVLGLHVLSVAPLHGKAAERARRVAFRNRKLAKGRVSQQDLVLMVSKKKTKKKNPCLRESCTDLLPLFPAPAWRNQ